MPTREGGAGLPREVIARLEELVQGELRPDLTILLDVDVGTGSARMESRGEPDRFEREAQEFKQRVRSAYHDIASESPGRVRVVDAGCGLDEVQAALDQILGEFIDG